MNDLSNVDAHIYIRRITEKANGNATIECEVSEEFMRLCVKNFIHEAIKEAINNAVSNRKTETSIRPQAPNAVKSSCDACGGSKLYKCPTCD